MRQSMRRTDCFATLAIDGRGQNVALGAIRRIMRVNRSPDRFAPNDGRGDRIRTCDPHTPSVMRYQAALLPDRRRALRRGRARRQAA